MKMQILFLIFILNVYFTAAKKQRHYNNPWQNIFNA